MVIIVLVPANTGDQMKKHITPAKPSFPARKWATSNIPVCPNPNCCSSKSQKTLYDTDTIPAECTDNECMNGRHTTNCCIAEGNRACTPGDWVVLYHQVKPGWEDSVRRKWMDPGMLGRCSLKEAIAGFKKEWGEVEQLESIMTGNEYAQRVAA